MRWGSLLLLAMVIAVPAFGQRAAARVEIKETSKALEFDYSWPAEAAGIRPLDRRFREDAQRALRRAHKDAEEDVKLAASQKREFHQHFFSRSWAAVGQSARLLSLESATGTFTGGAHPNSSNGALLWERRLNREIPVASLFLRPRALETLTRTTYCKKLEAERRKRREGEKLGGQFDDCPKYSELAIALFDGDMDHHYDRIRFVASPYVAGPYVEGAYEIDVPVSRQLMAAIKPAYRTSFEPQRQ
jgi:hypothetical protein